MLYLIAIPLEIVAATQPRIPTLVLFLIAIALTIVAWKRGWGKRATYPLLTSLCIELLLQYASFFGVGPISPHLINVVEFFVLIPVIIALVVMIIKSEKS